jgi:hypothetical protein
MLDKIIKSGCVEQHSSVVRSIIIVQVDYCLQPGLTIDVNTITILCYTVYISMGLTVVPEWHIAAF